MRQTILFRTGLAVLCGLMLTATGLWAAGSSDGGDSAAAADKKYVTDPTTGKVVSAPEYGGTLTYGTMLEPDNADSFFFHLPVLAAGGVVETLGLLNWAIDRDVFSFRTHYQPEFAYTSHLAESWDTPDPLTIIFNIRKGIKWQNKAPMNGREFTADDVVHSFQRMLGMGDFAEAGPSPFTYARPSAESITAPDKYTVVVKLTEPNTAILVLFAGGSSHALIYPPEVIKQYGDAKDWRTWSVPGRIC